MGSMSERTILTVATGLIGASWIYYFALYLQPSSNLRWAAIPTHMVALLRRPPN